MLKQSAPNEIDIKTSSRLQPLIGVLLVLLSLLAYMFWAAPVADEAELIAQEVEVETARLDSLKMELSKLQEAEATLGASSEVQRNEILKSIPIGLNQDEVIEDVIEIAASHDVELNSIGFSKGQSSREGVGVLRINAGFEGGYNDLTNFLKGLEQNLRLFVVNSISVQVKVLEVTEFKRANFTLSIEAYYQIEQ